MLEGATVYAHRLDHNGTATLRNYETHRSYARCCSQSPRIIEILIRSYSLKLDYNRTPVTFYVSAVEMSFMHEHIKYIYYELECACQLFTDLVKKFRSMYHVNICYVCMLNVTYAYVYT